MKRTLALCLTIAFALTPFVALADDDDQGWKHDNGNQDWKHDNGHHYGSSKHHKHVLIGRITAINGNLVTIQRNDGRSVTVDDTPAVNSGHASALGIGQYVRVNFIVTEGTNVATAITPQAGNGQYGNNGNHVSVYGRVIAINGNWLTLRTSDGRTISVDESQAASRGQVNNVSVGTWVQVNGYWSGNTLVAQSVNGNNNASQPGPNGVTLPGGIYVPIGK